VDKNEALKLALEAFEWNYNTDLDNIPACEKWAKMLKENIAAIKKVLAQPEQEPVAWLITDEKINSLQVDSIQRLIDRAKHAHMTDIKLRINGQDEWYEADWLKHLTHTTTPQRKWVGLTDEEITELHHEIKVRLMGTYKTEDIYRAIEAKLREKNG